MTVETLNKVFLLGKEPVGNPGSGDPGALVAADAIHSQALDIVNVPALEPRLDHTPNRQGTGYAPVGAANPFSGSWWLRDFTVPNTDEGSRPPDDKVFIIAGYTAVWSDEGAGIYRLTYTLQDHKDTKASGFIAKLSQNSDGVTMIREGWNGIRANHTLLLTPGRPFQMDLEGLGANYTRSTDVATITGLVYNQSPEIRFGVKNNVVLTVVGGSVFSGQISGIEVRAMMNVSTTPGGGLDGIGEITTVPTEAYEIDVTADVAKVSTGNNFMENLHDGEFLELAMNQPTTTLKNIVRGLWYFQIVALEPEDFGNRMEWSVKGKGVFADATNPARSPVNPFQFIFETDTNP